MQPEKYSAFPALFKNASNTVAVPLSAHRLAKSAALAWKKTGSTEYSNSGTDSDPVWDIRSRDTAIYDAAGNVILEMRSATQTGWAGDSLRSIDSTRYSNGKIVETVHRSFNRDYFGTLTTYGYRTVNSYLNNDRTILSIYYEWDDSVRTWILSFKDSTTFSSPVTGKFDFSDLTTLTGTFSWRFDSASNDWIGRGFYRKVDGECTATRLVLAGKASFDYISDSLVDEKWILEFSSPAWTQNNFVEQLCQRRYSPSGAFVNYSRYIREVNAAGRQTRTTSFDWDTTKLVWVGSNVEINFPDAYGNDTLNFWADFDTASSIWDTNSRSRYQRTYDANGNNTVILSYAYDDFDGTWELSEKTVNTFTQINQSVRFTVKPAVNQNITVRISPASVTFAGRNIEGVDLFNAAGRPVLSIRQKPSATLQISPVRPSIPAGVYIARVRTSSGEISLRLPLYR
jgi:hypothetical protein